MAEHLMGPGEIRERLGRLSRQRVYQITTDPSFPKPYDELRMGKVWRIEDVEAWINEYLRRAGASYCQHNQVDPLPRVETKSRDGTARD